MSNRMYSVNGSNRFVLEVVPDSSVIIWDTEIEAALQDLPNGIGPLLARAPSPIIASGLTQEEAFDWLMEELRLDREFIPVTRIQ